MSSEDPDLPPNELFVLRTKTSEMLTDRSDLDRRGRTEPREDSFPSVCNVKLQTCGSLVFHFLSITSVAML